LIKFLLCFIAFWPVQSGQTYTDPVHKWSLEYPNEWTKKTLGAAGGRNLKIKQYFFIRNELTYLITYTADPAQYTRYEGTATKVMNSFTFLPSK
jgi:hypothetical protein